jgi:hypothetical protein
MRSFHHRKSVDLQSVERFVTNPSETTMNINKNPDKNAIVVPDDRILVDIFFSLRDSASPRAI